MKRVFSSVIIFISITTAFGQYVDNALRFSQNMPTLTARSMAMGGAFTALGGDFSSAYLNPAGLGLFRKSEFHFSPALNYSNTDATYQSESHRDYRYQVFTSSAGYIGTINTNKEKGLVSTSYAIGYNRLNNFGSNIYIRGMNDNSSLSDYFVETANGWYPNELNPFYEKLAFDAWVVDTLGAMDQYTSLVPVPIEQRKSVQHKGGAGEWSFAFGMNFSNVLYWGMSLGIDALRYDVSSVYSEYNSDDYYAFRSFDFNEESKVRGTGINFKTGVIVRVANTVRVGANIQIPTFYNIKETYYNTLYSEYDDSSFYMVPVDEDGYELDWGEFRYNFNTPLKLSGGASVQIGKSGLVSGDIEFIDYSSMKMRTSNDFDSRDDQDLVDYVNENIDNVYRPVLNIKLGAEFRVNNLAIRAGWGYYPSPYSSEELNKKATYTQISSGIGYRDNNFFIDLAFSGLLHKEKYNLYTSNLTPNVASLNQNTFRMIATVGIKL